MITDINFGNSGNNCNVSCIESSSITPTKNFTLPAANGSLVSVTATAAPTLFSGMFVFELI
jgi:hypothetical protein